MAGQRGRDVLIKIDAGGGVFVTVAGIRTTRFQLSQTRVEGTSAESEQAWRELLPGAGIKSVRVSGSGVFKDGESDALLRTAFFEGSAPVLQLVVPDFGTLTGRFLVAELVWGGAHDGEATFSVTLESAGSTVFGVL